jgi:hypothetical protein
MDEEDYVICNVHLENCICGLPKDHPEDQPHLCYTGECGGQWYGDDDFFVPITIPVMGIPCPFTYDDYLKLKGARES